MGVPTFEVSLRDDLTLPQGRYLMSRDQVSEIWGFNEHRRGIIDGGFVFIDTVTTIVPVHSVWIGGSLLSSKASPDDFDVTLLVDLDDFRARKSVLLNPPSLKRLGEGLGVRVDPFAIPWRPRLDLTAESEEDRFILRERGYWDDWWLRRRGRDNGEPEYVEALPRRGYVEVMINGYA